MHWNNASTQELIYSNTVKGGLAVTGNTPGLSKELDANGPGDCNSIGTFVAADPLSVDDDSANPANPWPAGTTADWTENGSSAILNIPAGSTVLYAYLIWGGSYHYGTEDVSAFLDNAVTLAYSDNSVDWVNTSVSPDLSVAQTLNEISYSGFLIAYYMRSNSVTDFISQNGSGTYSVQGVPATQDTNVNSLNAVGWVLVVAYENSTEPFRMIALEINCDYVDDDNECDWYFDNFSTKPSGTAEGKLFVCAMEGDANSLGDSVLIGGSSPALTLSGTNNMASNFFASQINSFPSVIDTSGSFGNNNHNATTATTSSGGRQGWDISALDISSSQGYLANDQQELSVRMTTTSDGFATTMAAVQIDIAAPDLSASLGIADYSGLWNVGQSVTAQLTVDNAGASAAAESAEISFSVPEGIELSAVTVDGTPHSLENPVVLGTIPIDASTDINLVFQMTEAQAASSVDLDLVLDYQFEASAVNQTHSLTGDILNVNRPPTEPVPLLPESGATVDADAVQLVWTGSEDADNDEISYSVLLSTNPGLSDPTLIHVDSISPVYKYSGMGGLMALLAFSVFRKKQRLAFLTVILALLLLSCNIGKTSNSVFEPDEGEFTVAIEDLESGTHYYWAVTADDGRGAVSKSKTADFIVP